jgi:hypothetical protein
MKETGPSFASICCLEEVRIAEVIGRTLIASVTGEKTQTVFCEKFIVKHEFCLNCPFCTFTNAISCAIYVLILTEII